MTAVVPYVVPRTTHLYPLPHPPPNARRGKGSSVDDVFNFLHPLTLQPTAHVQSTGPQLPPPAALSFPFRRPSSTDPETSPVESYSSRGPCIVNGDTRLKPTTTAADSLTTSNPSKIRSTGRGGGSTSLGRYEKQDIEAQPFAPVAHLGRRPRGYELSNCAEPDCILEGLAPSHPFCGTRRCLMTSP